MLSLNYNENGLKTGQVSFARDRILSRIKARPSIVSITPAFAPERAQAEDFIKSIYKKSYDASIEIHYPVIMSVQNADGDLLAATGFRFAAKEPLFLEQYLDAPIDNIIHTQRSKIVEIGNLASQGGGASLYLFAALAAYLNYQEISHAVVTSTDFLERRFRQMGLRPERLAKADPSLLIGQGESWGSYYSTQPHVIAGSVTRGYKCLQKQLGIEYADYRPRLFPRLHYKPSTHA